MGHNRAVYHQALAGNCLIAPTERCRNVGLGPAFDCSGLVIRSICDVLGVDPQDWPPDMRHVRDMWGMSLGQGELAALGSSAIARLVVFRRYYDTPTGPLEVAGHVGMVSTVDSTGSFTFVHADPRTGRIEERSSMTSQTMLGFIALAEGPGATVRLQGRPIRP